jgi:hypothetical protein
MRSFIVRGCVLVVQASAQLVSRRGMTRLETWNPRKERGIWCGFYRDCCRITRDLDLFPRFTLRRIKPSPLSLRPQASDLIMTSVPFSSIPLHHLQRNVNERGCLPPFSTRCSHPTRRDDGFNTETAIQPRENLIRQERRNLHQNTRLGARTQN